jgi:hypothetical protein
MKTEKPSVSNYISPFIMIALGVWHYVRHGVDLVTIIPISLGIFALYLVLFNHPLLQGVLTYLTKIWYPIGQFITILLFVFTFFLIFAPVGILLRLFKKDILNRNFEQKQLTYWIERPVKEQNNYTQQF